MVYRLLADALVGIHLAFVLFVAIGALAVVRWPRLAWVHLPAVIWGVGIELLGAVCPLTPMENRLRALAGERGYGGGFIEHYLLPVLYPGGLTRGVQIALGVLALAINLALYGWLVLRRRQRSIC